MKMSLSTVETIGLPENWMPASKAREIATSISNEKTMNFLNNQISNMAAQGSFMIKHHLCQMRLNI